MQRRRTRRAEGGRRRSGEAEAERGRHVPGPRADDLKTIRGEALFQQAGEQLAKAHKDWLPVEFGQESRPVLRLLADLPGAGSETERRRAGLLRLLHGPEPTEHRILPRRRAGSRDRGNPAAAESSPAVASRLLEPHPQEGDPGAHVRHGTERGQPSTRASRRASWPSTPRSCSASPTASRCPTRAGRRRQAVLPASRSGTRTPPSSCPTGRGAGIPWAPGYRPQQLAETPAAESRSSASETRHLGEGGPPGSWHLSPRGTPSQENRKWVKCCSHTPENDWSGSAFVARPCSRSESRARAGNWSRRRRHDPARRFSGRTRRVRHGHGAAAQPHQGRDRSHRRDLPRRRGPRIRPVSSAAIAGITKWTGERTSWDGRQGVAAGPLELFGTTGTPDGTISNPCA